MKWLKTDKILFKTREQVYHFLYGFILWIFAFSHALYLRDYFFYIKVDLLNIILEILSISFVITSASITIRILLKNDFIKNKNTIIYLFISYISEVIISALIIIFVRDYLFIAHDHSIPLFTYIIPLKIYELYLLEVDNMVGPFHLKKLFTDKFFKPKSEERVFLFADLVDSTQIAEQLGPEKYSQFLKESFEKFSVIYDYFGDIFQYVGDEVVITWKAENRHKSCYINGAIACKNALEGSSDYFLNKYGIKPQFRFSMHKGNVISTTIGKYKKEVSFHGNAINVTSRIQNYCKELDQGIIFSESIIDDVNLIGRQVIYLGNKEIRGIREKMKLYTINPF